jgi:uncharacterized membrane protein YfcA
VIASIALTMAGVFAAAFLRGFTGFGFGLAAVPLLSLALPPSQVVPLAVSLQVLVGLNGIREAVRVCDWRAISMLVPGLIAGVPIGLLILTELPPNPVRLLIGVIIAGSVLLVHKGATLPPRPSRLLGAGVGLISGIISGLASMGATAIIYFTIAGCVSFAPMAYKGLVTHTVLVWAAASIPALFGGARLGAWAFTRSRPRTHRLTALITLSVLAALLIGRALIG